MPSRLRASILASITTLILAGCAEQPIGNFESARFVAHGTEARHEVAFMPACTRLAPGEAERLQTFLKHLNLQRGDYIVATLVSTGSEQRDRERRASLRHAIETGPARLEIRTISPHEHTGASWNHALLRIARHDSVAVDCRDGGYSASDLAHRMPFPILNCANPSNLARMAADPRDLTHPRALGSARAEPTASAVRRHREGQVIFAPLAGIGGN